MHASLGAQLEYVRTCTFVFVYLLILEGIGMGGGRRQINDSSVALSTFEGLRACTHSCQQLAPPPSGARGPHPGPGGLQAAGQHCAERGSRWAEVTGGDRAYSSHACCPQQTQVPYCVVT